ncbi:MAG TPA: aminopeptidase [Blastocatellia bacterium]|nr:aminopeptidase [Blastocatellia bacterium]
MMKLQRLFLFTLVVFFLCFAACDSASTTSTEKAATASSTTATTANADAGAALTKPDYNAIAQKLVTQCVGVKEGDLVLINGGAGYTDFMDAVVVETAKVGGAPFANYVSDAANKRLDAEMPAKYDTRLDPFWMKALHPNLNVQILLPNEQDDWVTQIPVERQVTRRKTTVAMNEDYNKRNIRLVEVNNGLAPTVANAKRRGIPQAQLAKLFWDGVNVDYAMLQAKCDAVQATLATGNEVHITHTNGTDLKFRITKQPIFTSDGVISAEDAKRGGMAATVYLPAGEVYLPIVLGSAEGKLVVERMLENGKEIRGLTLNFSAGKLTAMTAASGNLAELKARYEASDANKSFLSGLDLGTNPQLKISNLDPTGAYVEAGTITFSVGSNHWLGGKHISNFDMAPRLIGGTLKVDGKVVVENGGLKL